MRLLPFAVTHSGHILRHALFVVMLSALGLETIAYSQVGGIDPDPGDRGTGGRNTIQGSIFLPSGQRLNRRVKVKLTGLGSAEQFQMSDDSGAFTFRRLKGGRYSIVIDAGSAFETTTESVDIVEPPRRRGDDGITVPVYITLLARASDAAGTPGTVAALPEAARELYKQALDSAKAGDRKKAIEQLNKALEIFPNFMAALNQLGVQCMEMKNWGKAIEVLRKAIGIAPEAFHPRLNYGIALVHMKDYKGAAAELKIAVQKDETSGTAHFYLGRAMVNLGNYDEAERCLQQSINLGGDGVVEAHRYLAAVYIEKQRANLAADELETYLKLAPGVKDAEQIRGVIKGLRSQASQSRE